MTPYWEVHPGTGPFLLLVHGFLCSRAQWKPNLDALRAVCRPVVVELYGHGRSPSPVDARAYAPEAYVAALDAIRAELGAASWFLCGASLGGALAIRYALTYPEHVRGLVFTNSMAAFAAIDSGGRRAEEGARSAQRILDGGMEEVERIRVHPKHARRLPRQIHDALMEDAALLDPAGVANTVRFTTPRASVRNDLAANRVPAILACGHFEKRFQPQREFVVANMPQLTVVDMDAGHAVNMQAVEQFNRAVIDFLSTSVRTFGPSISRASELAEERPHAGINCPIEAK